MNLALVQMVSGLQVQANLERARALMAQAAQAGAELVVLPEYFCLLGRQDSDKLAIRETPGQGPIQAFLSHSARTLGLWIVGGTLPLQTQPPQAARALNSTRVYAPSGDCVAQYDKIHLFRYQNANGSEHYDETRSLQAGQQLARFALPSRDGHTWQVGLSVCYDLRFPELYREHARAGAELLLVPSAFTHGTGQAHWEPLLRARAIENLSYVAAAAQGGRHESGRQTWGHSMVLDPWGRILALRAQDWGLVQAELHIDSLRQYRQQLPALTHRVL